MNKIICIIFAIALSVQGFTQTFSSVKCVLANTIMDYPIIQLNTSNQVHVSFDEISVDSRSLEYRFVLCNADWENSDLQPIQYLQGTNYNAITDVRFSLNTRTDYTHYEFSFPDNYTKFLLSGNYKCEIYDVNEPEITLETIHFFVSEQSVEINAKVIPPKRVEYRRSKQELEFDITSSRFDIQQPYQNLKVLIQQNGRDDNVRKVSPQYIVGKTLKFTNSEDLVFDGSDEFRNFESRFLSFNGYGVEDISTMNNQYLVQVYAGESRATKIYTNGDDLNGRFYVRADRRNEPEIEAEYIYVYFPLYTNYQGKDASVHLYGALTHWSIDENSEMTYNFEKNCYEKLLFLKQGFYDYQYVYFDKKTEILDITRFEGNHQETENDYIIYVYYKGFSDNHDRLIGTAVISSNE